MRIALYFDEDSQENDLIHALRLREAQVYSSAEAGLNGRTDEEQLTFAATEGYVLYSYNSRDFYQLHTQFLAAGKTHSGIILGPQQQYSVGEQMRRLLKIISAKPAEEMENQVEFLGAWGE